MRFDLETADAGKNQIRSYGPDFILVNDKKISQNCLITPTQIIEFESPSSLDDFIANILNQFNTEKPEVLLIGTSNQVIFPATNVLEMLINAKLGYEFMTTPAACRTYNLLMLEGRKVAAALLLKM